MNTSGCHFNHGDIGTSICEGVKKFLISIFILISVIARIYISKMSLTVNHNSVGN